MADATPPQSNDPPTVPAQGRGQPQRLRGEGLEQEAGALRLAGVGLELAGVVAALTLLGWWLDNRWGTLPWLLLTGMALGIVGGLYNVWRRARRYFK